MLILTRRIQEQIVIGNKGEIKITVLSIKGKQAKLAIEAPDHIPVDREEIWQLKQQNKSTEPTDEDMLKQLAAICNNTLEKTDAPSATATFVNSYRELRTLPTVIHNMLSDLLHLPNKSMMQLAKEMNISERTLRRVMTGITTYPSIKTSHSIFILHCHYCSPRHTKPLTKPAELTAAM